MVEIIWNQFLAIAREEVGSRVVETWFKAISVQRWDQYTKTIFMSAPNDFIRSWVEQHYQGLLCTHLARLLHVDSIQVVFSNTVEDRSIITPLSLATHAKIIPAQGLQGNKLP